MDIEKIREACILRKIKWSVHVAARMAERDIKRSDVCTDPQKLDLRI